MSKKTYDNKLSEIAEPVVKNLVEQAIHARRFRMRFPSFFNTLLEYKHDMRKVLFYKLYQYMRNYNKGASNTKIEEDVFVILYQRHFLDHAIGFIQTGRLTVADEFLVQQKILSRERIESLFAERATLFWQRANITDGLKGAVLSYLDQNKLYLPNLFPTYNIEVLLSDFLPIYLQYARFETNQRSIGLKETSEVLNPLFEYPSPLHILNSYIEFNPHLTPTIDLEYYSIAVSFDEKPKNLAYILRDFLIQYKSRRMDKMRQGTDRAYDAKSDHEITQLAEISRPLLKVLDELTASKIGNERPVHTFSYIALLNSLVGLYYFDRHFEHTFADQNLDKVDEISIKKFIEQDADFSFKENNEPNPFDDFVRNSPPLDMMQFMKDDLEEALKISDFLEVKCLLRNQKSSQTQDIICFLKEINPTTGVLSMNNKSPFHKFTKQNLSKTILPFLKKYIPEAEVFIKF